MVSAARERIVETAFRLFYAHGVRGVGVDTIVAESGVAKATLYKHFPGKDDLVVAYLDKADAAWRDSLARAAKEAGDDPRDRLVGLFDALGAACRRDGFHGCAFMNTAAETPPGSPAHARTVEHKAVVRAWIRELAAEAGAGDPDVLATGLSLLLDGGLASGVLDGRPEVADAAKAAARSLVDLACPAA